VRIASFKNAAMEMRASAPLKEAAHGILNFTILAAVVLE